MNYKFCTKNLTLDENENDNENDNYHDNDNNNENENKQKKIFLIICKNELLSIQWARNLKEGKRKIL